MSDNFTVWFTERKGIPARKVGSTYNEPAEAADRGETYLDNWGVPGESFCEIKYNGDIEAHTIITLIEGGRLSNSQPTLGIWNTDSALWPIWYADTGDFGVMLESNPLAREGDEEGDVEEDGKHDKDENADKMDLGGQDDDEDEDEGDEEDGADSESEDDTEDYPEDEEDDEDDFTDDEEDEDESPEDDADEERESDDGDDDSDDENDPLNDEEGDNEEEKEMPRLNIFAKMRGPKGWRKRAEAEELNERNVFGLKIGILNPDEDLTAAQQERNVRAHIEFVEADETRRHGVLKLRLPKGVELADFSQSKSGVITVDIPYLDED